MNFSETDGNLKQLERGAFLTVKDRDGRINAMTIGWGQEGIMWGKRVFIAPVRPSRFTYELIENAIDYSVSFPKEGELKKELAYFGTKSGRDGDKFAATGLRIEESEKIESPHIAGCESVYECRILMILKTDSTVLPESVQERYYPDGDDHYLYIGEIL